MRQHSPLWHWVWDRRIFRNLRPRVMTMLLVLVLPLSIICNIVSVVSALQITAGIYTNGNNGLSFFVNASVLRSLLNGEDLMADFPAAPARRMAPVAQFTEENGGKMYISRDGIEAWQVFPDGSAEPAAASLDALRKAGRDSFYCEAADAPLIVLAAFPYSFTMRYLPSWVWIAIGFSVLSLVICPFLFQRLKKDILDPVQTMRAAMDGLRTDLSYRIPPHEPDISDDFLSLFDDFNVMAQEVQASHDKDVRMVEAEMENLRLQVNPHMLLNSYNMIYALAQSKNYTVIQDYTLALVDYFRYVLRRGEQLVPLKQELSFIDTFIHLQRIRFPGRFSYMYQAEDDCLEALIPPLLIENFVENAVKYALTPADPIEIIVTVRRETKTSGEERLRISVTDTGSGIRPEILEKLKAREPYVDEAGHRHIGIWNCMRRVELFYGERGSIHFASGEGAGTQVFLSIPYQAEEASPAQP